MSFYPDQLPARMGFNLQNEDERACFAPAVALAIVFTLLPCALLTPLDTDRTLPLLFLPAVWLGWKIARTVTPRVRLLTLAIFTAMAVSTACAAHGARALVEVSAVIWVMAGGMVALNLSRCLPAVRVVLGGIALGSALGAGLVSVGAGGNYMDFPTYWGARIFSMHQFAGAAAGLGWLALRPPTRAGRIAALTLTAIACTGLAASGSRAPVAGMGTMVVAWFWFGSAADRRLLLRTLPALTIVALGISWLIGTPYGQMGWWAAIERTAQAKSLVATASGREYFWTVVWQQAWESPWIGHGADAYQYIQPRLHGAQPHNALLQWLYEYGLAGLVPILLLLGVGVSGLFRRSDAENTNATTFRIWACATLAGALAYGLFDGIFYHMIVFMPVAAFAGFALGATPRPAGADHPFLRLANWQRVLRPVLLAGMSAILLHAWLGLLLLRAPNVAPDSTPARILRAFPSTTFGLNLWINRWETTHPEVVMDWIKWAQSASNQQPEFHIAALMIHFRNKDFISAERELRACLPKVRDIERADLKHLLAGVTVEARKQAGAAAAAAAEK